MARGFIDLSVIKFEPMAVRLFDLLRLCIYWAWASLLVLKDKEFEISCSSMPSVVKI